MRKRSRRWKEKRCTSRPFFRDRANQKASSRLVIRGKGGATSETSPLAIDQQYQQFMSETFKEGS
jgi:hypothetical protein